MSKVYDAAQKAFEKGQEAWRHGKDQNQNPYDDGLQSGAWQDGWEIENDNQIK